MRVPIWILWRGLIYLGKEQKYIILFKILVYLWQIYFIFWIGRLKRENNISTATVPTASTKFTWPLIYCQIRKTPVYFRPLIAANFSDNLLSIFLLNILSVPAVILHISCMAQEVRLTSRFAHLYLLWTFLSTYNNSYNYSGYLKHVSTYSCCSHAIFSAHFISWALW